MTIADMRGTKFLDDYDFEIDTHSAVSLRPRWRRGILNRCASLSVLIHRASEEAYRVFDIHYDRGAEFVS